MNNIIGDLKPITNTNLKKLTMNNFIGDLSPLANTKLVEIKMNSSMVI